MTPSYAYNHGLRYRYYTCSNHIRHKSCLSKIKTVPAEDVEQKVVDEIIKILRSPEIIMNIEKIINESKQDREILKSNLINVLNNLTDVWGYLYPTEQQKVCKMLLDEVSIGESGIRIRTNLDGFDKVMLGIMG